MSGSDCAAERSLQGGSILRHGSHQRDEHPAAAASPPAPPPSADLAARGASLAHHELGGTGPEVLVMLHATGFHGRMFLPMAACLASRFRCIALDLPGHGDSAHVQLPPGFQPQDVALMVEAKLQQLDLKGCFCFGHSWGAAMALLLESLRPGTFTAIYTYEPVLATLALRQQLIDGATPPLPLHDMALRRRSRWASAEEALQLLQPKPPFSSFCPRVLELYLEHGLRRCSGSDPGVELCCSPHVEASVYAAMDPPPALDGTQVQCPVVIALGQDLPGIHQRLVVLGPALQKELPRSRLERFAGLTHFGPLERPEQVAGSVITAFTSLGALAAERPFSKL